VDDSAFDRRLIRMSLQAESDIEILAEAGDAYEARDLILKHKPDLITLDISMPRMDGLTFLELLMKSYPIPVIILSALSPANSRYALNALELGAADVLSKVRGNQTLRDVGASLGSRIRDILEGRKRAGALDNGSGLKPRPPLPALNWKPEQVCLIGASTGGTVALKQVLSALPAEMPGICVVQHMPAFMTELFADRLHADCALTVREAKDGDWVEPGCVLLAPGDYHMSLVRESGRYRVRLDQSPKVWFQRPAVDVLFRSAVSVAGKNALGVLLTGMGRDGAEGLLELKEAGAHTITQDEASCAVYGMPKVAFELGASREVRSLGQMPEAIFRGLAQGVR